MSLPINIKSRFPLLRAIWNPLRARSLRHGARPPLRGARPLLRGALAPGCEGFQADVLRRQP
eukprot:5942865-Pleurochrysis_carterae.AAC.2